MIRQDITAKTPFEGLNTNEYVAFTMPATGLSVFQSDIFPNWIIFATKSDLVSKTIRSTSSDDLDFVYINAGNVSVSDPSLMNGIRRSITTPDIADTAGVPDSTVIPHPKSVTVDQTKLVILNNSQTWYIWADKRVSADLRRRYYRKCFSHEYQTFVKCRVR